MHALSGWPSRHSGGLVSLSERDSVQPSYPSASRGLEISSIAELADWRPVLHPAGTDDALASVLGDVASGRWLAMANLLADRDSADPGVRCTRTLLLARVAAGTETVEQWLAERPHDDDASAMRSRVAVERACAAIVTASSSEGAGILRRAEVACHDAVQRVPTDPVPYLGLLALACVRRAFTEGPGMCPVAGPWKEFADVWRVDQGNREAAHRMLGAIAVSGGGNRASDAQAFARWIASLPEISAASPIKVLPLYALVALWEARNGTSRADGLPYLQWTTDAAFADIVTAWDWFRLAEPARRLVLDLSHLAHALWAAQRMEFAAEVFEALGDYGAMRPWDQVAANGVAEVVRARAQSIAARYRSRDTPG